MPAHRHSTALAEPGTRDMGRRRFLGYLIAAPTLAVAVGAGIEFLDEVPAHAAVPSPPEPSDLYDLSDALTDAARPTANLISIVVNEDGSVSFAVPRAECGQGMTTALAMVIAEEMDLPLDKVNMTLADARPELLFNQLTGGSNTIHAMYTPVRVAAAIAKGKLLDAAAAIMQEQAAQLTSREGLITGPAGQVLGYGDLAKAAAVTKSVQVAAPVLKPESQFRIVGKPTGRIDALDIVTGRKRFAMDIEVPDAKPTMVCRAPTINGTPKKLKNAFDVMAMPGVLDLAIIATGVAVRAETFGQCMDAIRAMDVTWGPGTVDGESDETVIAKLKAATLPLAPAAPGTKVIDTEFTFAFASSSPLETNCAVADVREDRAEIWGSLKVPITALQEIALMLGMPQSAVTVHVAQGGGSFGRHLFPDAAKEAAEASQKMGKPVKLMWHRTDDFRQGRTHPMCTSTIRTAYAGGNVVSFQQNHTSVQTDFSHGLGEIITATAAKLPGGNYSLAQSIFLLTQNTPYNFGVATQLLNEIDLKFNTGSMRNVYSPNVRCAQELVVDQLAAAMGQDPVEFRRAFLKTDLQRSVLDKAAEVGEWGRSLPDGVAQGIAVHCEYKNTMAALVEVDTRPDTVNREIKDAMTGPRVTRATYVIVPGSLCINPTGLEAMMMGGLMDATSMALTGSLHMKDGMPLEGSWDNYFYTRQWNTPPKLEVVIMPPDPSGEVGGGGEAGVAASMGAIACAYSRAVGKTQTFFPVNHNDPLRFEPYPLVPPIPESPTDGLTNPL
ncbi:MAG: iorB [Pseudonocardia sp.]|jgi:isoquinoline 1-oxidoreductase beta subunit|nr:iorB [Pseudonocardia sp.]MDT7616601.1 isoquinoline 1-oxidoreductase subunit beta [Pseudonocardiales bacterium]